MTITNRGVTAKRLTSSGVVTTAGAAGLLYGAILKGGTTASSLLLEDGGSGGGGLCELSLVAQTAVGDDMKLITFSDPVVFPTDIFATIAGTGAVAYIYFREIG